MIDIARDCAIREFQDVHACPFVEVDQRNQGALRQLLCRIAVWIEAARAASLTGRVITAAKIEVGIIRHSVL